MPFRTDQHGLIYEFATGMLKGTQWEIGAAVCQGPTCGCLVLTLDLRPVSTAGGGAAAVRRVAVDLRAHAVETSDRSHDFELGEVFVKELGQPEWETLERVFHQRKCELYEATDLVGVDYDFPWEEIEFDGLLVYYNDVFPFHNRMHFDAGGHEWTAFDGHCVRPSCACRESIVGICHVTPGRDGEPGEGRELFSVKIDVDTGKWTVDRHYESSPVPPHAVVAAFLEQIPLALLRERHDTLRGMYLRQRPTEFARLLPATPRIAPTVRDTPKIGRNDPCPCGSGKKYKKCCGR